MLRYFTDMSPRIRHVAQVVVPNKWEIKPWLLFTIPFSGAYIKKGHMGHLISLTVNQTTESLARILSQSDYYPSCIHIRYIKKSILGAELDTH